MGIVISSILHMRKIYSFRDLSRCMHDTSTYRLFTYFVGLGDTEYKNMLLCFLSTTGTHLSAVYCCDPLSEHAHLSDCLCWLLLLGGMQAWEHAVTMALVFSCSNVKVWFRREHDLCAPFISELPLGRAKVRETISVFVAFSPVYSSFGSSCQHVSPVFCSISEGRSPQIVEVICSGQELASVWSGSGSPSLSPLSPASPSRGLRKYTGQCFSAWKHPAAKAKAGCSMLESKAWYGLEVGSRKQQ